MDLELGVKFSNWEWSLRIGSEVFEFVAMFSNLERCFRIRSGVLELGVVILNSEYVCEFRVMFSNWK